MEPSVYLDESERTERKFKDGAILSQHQIELLHAAMGVATEGCEVLDILKKHIIYDKKLDHEHLAEECGDILWYIAIICRRLGYSFEELMQDNIDKLAKRYPGKFSSSHAINRD